MNHAQSRPGTVIQSGPWGREGRDPFYDRGWCGGLSRRRFRRLTATMT